MKLKDVLCQINPNGRVIHHDCSHSCIRGNCCTLAYFDVLWGGVNYSIHFDGYPSHMLPGLARWTPEELLAAREIRHVGTDVLDCYDPPRAPRILHQPTCELSHLYIWQAGAWRELTSLRGVQEK